MFKSGFFNLSKTTMGDSIDVEDSLELEYDMWDGQFDFVGPQETPVRPRITSDGSLIEDLFTGSPLTPHLSTGLNGGKKTAAHLWCDNLSDQVQLLQQQVTTLADTQSSTDERYARAKAENAVGRLRGVAETLRANAEISARSAKEAQEAAGELAAQLNAAREARCW
ncbi:unnamed protein product [Leptidea sinapis]|uniref:Uncharacterized protein n=1 Tax=Leptidea sinapis TaxID=189913 RepID=A0A5E4QYZ4_9NEOP|nr:unnamed protein product [Leptidea sinapis]